MRAKSFIIFFRENFLALWTAGKVARSTTSYNYCESLFLRLIKFTTRIFPCNFLCDLTNRKRGPRDDVIISLEWTRVILNIVIRGDWLWKAANINDKNNSAAVYVGSTLKVHNPLFSVGKLWRNKLMQRSYWSIQSKW